MKKFGKEYISIQLIGKKRFLIGIVAGIITAISISLLSNYTREAFRIMSYFSSDLQILDRDALLFFNFFFTFLSTVLALSVTIFIWMSNRINIRKKDSLYKNLARSYSMLIFWVVIWLFARIGSSFSLSLFATRGYDNHLDLYHDYWLLFVLLPLVIFGQNWHAVRLIYKSGKWILFSFPACILLTLVLYKTTTVDQEIVNKIYFKKYEKDHRYIDHEISHAKTKYGINYDETTRETLKKQATDNSLQQVSTLQAAFSKKERVSLDTVILEKIAIHNLKVGFNNVDFSQWYYATPDNIFHQLQNFSPESPETTELFYLLKEEIDLANTPEIKWNESGNYTRTENRRSRYASYTIPNYIVKQLKIVRDSLIKNPEYKQLIFILPEIENKN